jgi:heme oxygenase
MTAARRPVPDREDDVLRRLRTATAEDHARVEAALALTAPDLDRDRLVRAMTALHGFWRAAEDGLAGWAARHPDDAARVDWPGRRRASLYAADLRALGAPAAAEGPGLPEVRSTDEALGRLYVLEGSTLGGTVIHTHLAGLPGLAAVRLRAFSPYGERTGDMWRAYRGTTRAHVAGEGDAAEVVRAARDTFAALARWVGGAVPAGRGPGSP